ncbi:MAG: hypothetical protein QOI57_1762 [Rubrobacteraceae bacterium]|nr:hypothetical protein [Rubrobacteraceae bacterium]
MAYVLGAVKLDPVTCLEGGTDDVPLLEGERGDYEEGGAGIGTLEGIEHPGRPQRVGTIVEGKRGPRLLMPCAEPRRRHYRSSFTATLDDCFFRP